MGKNVFLENGDCRGMTLKIQKSSKRNHTEKRVPRI